MQSHHLRVSKASRRLELWERDAVIRTFPVVLGPQPVGDKAVEGDGRTPEGTFYVCTRNAESRFHRFLGLSYPDARAAARGLREGLISDDQGTAILEACARGTRPPWDTALGGQIGIHGHGPRFAEAGRDWTQGCIALSDADMECLWEACPLGTGVIIEP